MAQEPITVDRLSSLLERFRVSAKLSYSGAMSGMQSFGHQAGIGHLHVLRRGSLSVSHPPGSALASRLELSEPCLLLYPRPSPHTFYNSPADGTDFTCAELEFEGGPNNPLLRAFPSLIYVPLQQVPHLSTSLNLLFSETDRVQCGQRLLANRLFEVVLIQLLRWVLDHPAHVLAHTGLLTGLAHPQLARALTGMHEQPAHNWNLENLAHCAGMSRTSFATTFKRVLGQTPATYLSDWRIAVAQSKLKSGTSLQRVADELGYSTPSALSRAFASRTGLTPREWLKQVAPAA